MNTYLVDQLQAKGKKINTPKIYKTTRWKNSLGCISSVEEKNNDLST